MMMLPFPLLLFFFSPSEALLSGQERALEKKRINTTLSDGLHSSSEYLDFNRIGRRGVNHDKYPQEHDVENPDTLPKFPTYSPTEKPTNAPSSEPTLSSSPTQVPSSYPSDRPTIAPSVTRTSMPSSRPSLYPSAPPSLTPTFSPSDLPSISPTIFPSVHPSSTPSASPSISAQPSTVPSDKPSISSAPSSNPSDKPSYSTYPSSAPTDLPSASGAPSFNPSLEPSISVAPSDAPSDIPSTAPSSFPTEHVCYSNAGFFGAESPTKVDLAFKYELETNSNATANVTGEVIPNLEAMISDLLLPLLFADSCSDGVRVRDRRRLRRRRLQVIGVSALPNDRIIQEECQVEKSNENNDCFLMQGLLTIFVAESDEDSVGEEQKTESLGEIKRGMDDNSLARAHKDIVKVTFLEEGIVTINEKPTEPKSNGAEDSEQRRLPMLTYAAIGLGLLLVIIAFLFFRRKLKKDDEEKSEASSDLSEETEKSWHLKDPVGEQNAP